MTTDVFAMRVVDSYALGFELMALSHFRSNTDLMRLEKLLLAIVVVAAHQVAYWFFFENASVPV